MKENFSISIVTPCFNAESYIEEAIKSVRDQNYKNVEHIVVDGGSTDATVEILEQHPEIKYISEPDNGIYDALNKGLKLANGDLIGWLNADDEYAEGAFDHVTSAYKKNPSCDLIAGDCIVFTQEDGSEREAKRKKFSDPEALSEGYIYHNDTLLNGCFIKSELINQIGDFDDQLQIGGDREYLIRLANSKPQLVRLDTAVYRYRMHEDSLTYNQGQTESWNISYEESMRYLPKFLSDESISDPLDNYCRTIFRSRSGILLRYYLFNRDLSNFSRILGTIFRTDRRWFLWAFQLVIRNPSILRNRLFTN